MVYASIATSNVNFLTVEEKNKKNDNFINIKNKEFSDLLKMSNLYNKYFINIGAANVTPSDTEFHIQLPIINSIFPTPVPKNELIKHIAFHKYNIIIIMYH